MNHGKLYFNAYIIRLIFMKSFFFFSGLPAKRSGFSPKGEDSGNARALSEFILQEGERTKKT